MFHIFGSQHQGMSSLWCTHSVLSVHISVPHQLKCGSVLEASGKPKARLPTLLQPYACMQQVVPVLRHSVTVSQSDSKLLLPSFSRIHPKLCAWGRLFWRLNKSGLQCKLRPAFRLLYRYTSQLLIIAMSTSIKKRRQVAPEAQHDNSCQRTILFSVRATVVPLPVAAAVGG